MEVIIIAAIALLVLVILAVLLIRGGISLGGGTMCESPSIQGECVESASDCRQGTVPSTHSCQTEGYVCCIPLSEDAN